MRRVHSFKSDLDLTNVEWGVAPHNNRHQITCEVALASVAAEGVITLSGLPKLGQTFTIGTMVWKFTVARLHPFDVAIGEDIDDQVDLMVAAIKADYGQGAIAARGPKKDWVLVTKDSGTELSIKWYELGTIGNAVTFTNTADNMAMDAATLGTSVAGVGDGSAHVPAAGVGTLKYFPHRAQSFETSTDTWDLTVAPKTKTIEGMYDVMSIAVASLDADCSMRIVYSGWKE